VLQDDRPGPRAAGSLVLHEVSMTDFRVFSSAVFRPAPEGTTVLTGANGTGKTTVLEAVAFLGSQRSFRGAPREAMIRAGRDRGYVRGELEDDGRRLTVETELSRGPGESRAQVNRQRARRAELARAVPVTVFSPDDLAVIQGGPAFRRTLLDDALASLEPALASAIEATERALRQRGALLRQVGGRTSPEVDSSLDVWDARLAASATELVAGRRRILDELAPLAERAYADLAGGSSARVVLGYVASWDGPYEEALRLRRAEDLRRAATTVGPHRDDVAVELGGRDSRLQASQGEQRCLALALRLGLHALLAARLGHPPLLLLDDVFSELDRDRAEALVRLLPVGQALLTTATPPPDMMDVALVLDVRELVA
jgi:DNA replication and repair protein RecF